MLSHYCRTRKGHQELKARTHKLTARQRALLLIIENVQWNDTDPASVQQLSSADNVKRLLELQLIEAVNDSSLTPGGTTVVEMPAVEAVPQVALQPASVVVVSRYKLILSAVAPKKPFGILYDFITLPAAMHAGAAPASAAVVTEESARKSVFMSYLPYLGGAKKPADEQPASMAAVATPESMEKPSVHAPVVDGDVLTEAVVASVDVDLVSDTDADQAELTVQAPVNITAAVETEVVPVELATSAEAEKVTEVTAAEQAAVEDATVAAGSAEDLLVEAAPVVGLQAETEVVLAAVEADVSGIDAEVAEPARAADEVIAAEENLPVVLATEATDVIMAVDEQSAVEQAAVEVQQAADMVDMAVADDGLVTQDIQLEVTGQVVHADSTAEAVEVPAETVTSAEARVVAVVAAPVVQSVNVISTLKVHAKQPVVNAGFGHNDGLNDVHVELVAKDGLDDGMLYIANHNKKWQERHIPLLVWTVTMPGTKKKQKKLDLPLKFYNVDEFEQVWDAKPPYGSH